MRSAAAAPPPALKTKPCERLQKHCLPTTLRWIVGETEPSKSTKQDQATAVSDLRRTEKSRQHKHSKSNSAVQHTWRQLARAFPSSGGGLVRHGHAARRLRLGRRAELPARARVPHPLAAVAGAGRRRRRGEGLAEGQDSKVMTGTAPFPKSGAGPGREQAPRADTAVASQSPLPRSCKARASLGYVSTCQAAAQQLR